MNIEKIIASKAITIFNEIYQQSLKYDVVQIIKTKKGFEGDYTIVLFPLLRYAKKAPVQVGKELGELLVQKDNFFSDYEIVGGYLNISINNAFWLNFVSEASKIQNYGLQLDNKEKKKIVIEFSAPNTNKPQHLGHIRNNLLGASLSRILKANGHDVVKVNLVNDRGIHICKSMLAWQKWGENATPQSVGKKGDHFVGDYYVLFNKKYNEEIEQLIESEGYTRKEAEKNSNLMLQAKKMLKKWERNNKKVRQIWQTMNDWVFEGFEKTYADLGIEFDKTYLESITYLSGKAIVLINMKKGRVQVADDDSIYINMEDKGLDKKILLRSDGTSVYMTQDLGTAVTRYEDYKFDEHIYVVGNEQDYHFNVLKIVLDKFGYEWSKDLQHFSYGMVELPDGKMKSREGKVVDADDLIAEMYKTAKQKTDELGKLDGFSEEEKNEIIRKISIAALKYFILRVDPKKNMTFNPAESIDFNGNTGPFIQYTYARINSILNKAKEQSIKIDNTILENIELQTIEKELIKSVFKYEKIITEAGTKHSPALLANYVYNLSKDYNRFYHDLPILKETDKNSKNFRLVLSQLVGNVIKSALNLLGIEVPERM